MGSAQIWPGPECLKTKPWPRVGESVVLKRFSEAHPLGFLPAMRRAVGQVDEVVWIDDEGNVMVRSGWWWARTAIEPVITRGIALAHVKARMERFLAWCRKNDACLLGMDFAKARSSPEQAMRDAAQSGHRDTRRHASWVAWTLDGDGPDGYWTKRLDAARRWDSQETLTEAVDAFLASPEWASLPWQQDPDEVLP